MIHTTVLPGDERFILSTPRNTRSSKSNVSRAFLLVSSHCRLMALIAPILLLSLVPNTRLGLDCSPEYDTVRSDLALQPSVGGISVTRLQLLPIYSSNIFGWWSQPNDFTYCGSLGSTDVFLGPNPTTDPPNYRKPSRFLFYILISVKKFH